VRRAITVLAVVVLLAGPTALAFFQGGYFDPARLIAAIVAWALFAVAALVSPQPLPRGRGGRLALIGLVLLTAWTGASIAWTPLSTPATDALQRLLLYVAALGAAAALLREPAARRATEPALALGTLVVVGYGLSERLLPGVFDLKRSTGAYGRLEQPLTYWNAMGALAAIGALLCTRIAADASRARWMRAAAAAATPALAVGVWLSYSRGALAALAIGLLVLAALNLTRAQLTAIGTAVVTGVIAAAAADGFDGVRALQGSSRESDGLKMLAILAVLSVIAAAVAWIAARRPAGPIALPRWAPAAIAATVLIAAAAVIGVAARDRGHPTASGASAQRLRSLESNRYAYWKVALRDGFAKEPLRGIGAGGFAVIWLEHRDVPERAKVAHSLYVETLSELGIVGFAFLAAFIGGLVLVALAAWRRQPGAVALLALWATHSALDWDWQMPALTLVPLVLAGLAIASAEDEPAGTAPRAHAGAGAEEEAVLA
jgi:O-Antigen ligase